MSEQPGWTTNHEKIFLGKLGTFKDYNKPKAVYLRGYLKSAENRVEWGGIDRFMVIEHAKKLLAKC